MLVGERAVALAAPARASGGPRRRRAARGRRPGRSRTRCGCPRRWSGRQWPGAVADEEDAVLDRRAQRVRDPVALVALGLARRRRAASATVGVLDVVARVEGADADADLVAGGERPRVAGGHVASGRATARGPSPAAGGWTSRPRDSSASGGWIALGASTSTRRQPSASTTAARVRSPRSVCTTYVARACARRPWRSRTRRRRLRRAAARTARGSRRSRTSTAARQRYGAPSGVCTTRSPKVWRIDALEAEVARSHSVGAAHAVVWRSPIS